MWRVSPSNAVVTLVWMWAATLFIGAGATAATNTIYSEDFSSPTSQSNSGANGSLGTGGAGAAYALGTWLYTGGNMGIDDPAEGDGSGDSNNNAISSIDHARVQDERGSNARAISLVLSGSLFANGVEYTVSFDVYGDASGNDAGRYWLAELYGYDSSGSNYIQIDGTHSGWGSGAGYPKPFTSHGSATTNYLKDSGSNGVAIDNENTAGTNSVSFTFTYDGANSADIGFAVGAYNNIFGIDNFRIVDPSAGTLVTRTIQFGGAATNIDTTAWISQIGADQIVQWNGENSWGGGSGSQGNLVNKGIGTTLVSSNSYLTLTSRTISSSNASRTNTVVYNQALGINSSDSFGANFQQSDAVLWAFDFDKDVELKQVIFSGLDAGNKDRMRVIASGVTNDLSPADTDETSSWSGAGNTEIYTFGTPVAVSAGDDITITTHTNQAPGYIDPANNKWGLYGVIVSYEEPAPEPEPIPDPLPPPPILPGLTAALDPVPNIVLFVADDMGIGDSSAYQDLTGNPDAKQIHTPNMERLAERGVRFTDVHTPGSTCTPSRIGLLSGSYPFRSPLKIKAANQTHIDGLMFPGRRHTMAHMLKRAGYRTYGYGKWHLGHQSDKEGSGLMIEGPLESGFDTYTGSDGNFGYPGAMIKDHQFMQFDADDNLVPYGASNAVPWIAGGGVWTGFKDPNLLKVQPAVFAALEADLATHMSTHTAKPLFIYYASHGNHDPYVAPGELAGHVISSNVTVSGTILNVPLDPGGDLDGDGIPDPDYADPDYVWSAGVVDKWWDPHFETNALGEVIYNGPTARARMVVENDIIVGELLDFLIDTDDPRNPGHKMIDNTLFIFTSDNGADMKSRYAVGKLPQDDGAGLVQLNGFKGTVMEGGTRVPFIAAMPGLLATNATSSAIFGLNDLYATVAEMIGHRLEADEAVDSESLLTAWTNGLDGVVRTDDLIYQHWQFLLARRGELKLHAKDGDYTGASDDRFADSNNLDFDDMIVNKFYDLSNDLNEANNLGSTSEAVDMLATVNLFGGQGYSRSGAEAPVNGPNFTGGDFFSDANWAGYGNIRDNIVPYSPMPGFICTNAIVSNNLTGMKLMQRYDTFDFVPPGTGTFMNTMFEVRGGTFYATNGPVALVDSQLHVADGLADLGSGVLAMNASTGTVISMGGTLSAGAISIGDQPGATDGAKTVRFEKGSGVIVLTDSDPIRFGDDGSSDNDFVNFTAGTEGRLVSVKGASFFEDLWTNGLLRIDGETGTGSFAESGFVLLDQGNGTQALMLGVEEVAPPSVGTLIVFR